MRTIIIFNDASKVQEVGAFPYRDLAAAQPVICMQDQGDVVPDQSPHTASGCFPCQFRCPVHLTTEGFNAQILFAVI